MIISEHNIIESAELAPGSVIVHTGTAYVLQRRKTSSEAGSMGGGWWVLGGGGFADSVLDDRGHRVYQLVGTVDVHALSCISALHPHGGPT